MNRYYDLQEILELGEEAIISHQDRLDRLLIISKTIQEDKENSARESVALNEKTDELSVKRTWMIQMRSEIREISYCVNKLNGIYESSLLCIKLIWNDNLNFLKLLCILL